jgi:hypothetical protein
MSDFGVTHKLALAQEIMGVIERYNDTHSIPHRPCEIRDTLLSVAGLLHLEHAKIVSRSFDGLQLRKAFAEASLVQYDAAIETSAAITAWRSLVRPNA